MSWSDTHLKSSHVQFFHTPLAVSEQDWKVRISTWTVQSNYTRNNFYIPQNFIWQLVNIAKCF